MVIRTAKNMLMVAIKKIYSTLYICIPFRGMYSVDIQKLDAHTHTHTLFLSLDNPSLFHFPPNGSSFFLFFYPFIFLSVFYLLLLLLLLLLFGFPPLLAVSSRYRFRRSDQRTAVQISSKRDTFFIPFLNGRSEWTKLHGATFRINQR